MTQGPLLVTIVPECFQHSIKDTFNFFTVRRRDIKTLKIKPLPYTTKSFNLKL